MQAVNLRCEYRQNPLGIAIPRPRLSWRLESDQPGARQTAYQIQVSLDGDVLWDTGPVESDQSLWVEYGGPALTSRQRLTWQVRVWDGEGNPTEWSEPAWWEMGLLESSDWAPLWIGAPFVGGPRTTIPVPFLRKNFTVGGNVIRARLYITSLGVYEAYINGHRIGDAELTPGWTDYHKRVYYQTYDVTDLLQAGDNVIGAILGDGWYCGFVAWSGRQLYGDRPRLLAQLEITIENDGDNARRSKMLIVSDRTWQTAFGPILESDLLMGESYDARLELGQWCAPHSLTPNPSPKGRGALPSPHGGWAGGEGGLWLPVEIFPAPKGMVLTAQNSPSIKRQEEVTPISVRQYDPKSWIFDLGQNMVGRVRLKVTGPAGTTIRLRYAEMLNPDGSVYLTNLRTARATDYYTLKGDPAGETWEPRFTFHGFRYVEVVGFPGAPNIDTITGIVLHSENPVTGSFECSDPLLNQLQHNILWGWKGNSLDVPTDCPQRDERVGWTGDAQVFCRTAAFNTDAAGFFAKWMQDVEDAQRADGGIPCVAPEPGVTHPRDGGPAWSDAAVIVPWSLYLAYGDRRILEERYAMMERYLAYLQSASPNLIRSDPAFDPWGGHGDWLALDGAVNREGSTPKDLIGTAFFAYSARLLSQIAAQLGKTADAQKYTDLFEVVRAAFLRRFVTQEGYIAGATQTSYVLGLMSDLLPADKRRVALDWIVSDIRCRGDHLSTGFVGTSYLPFVLTDGGCNDVAYDLLFQKSWPSFLYAVTQGATTIWERWDGWTHDRGFQDPAMNSYNHYAYGAIGDWLYRVVAGINLDWQQPAYKHIIFRPLPPTDGRLTHAKASIQSPYGFVGSEWHIEENGQFILEVVVPPNTTATIYLPGETDGRKVAAGQHRFAVTR
jgi:alpha-L-rhamnosidase